MAIDFKQETQFRKLKQNRTSLREGTRSTCKGADKAAMELLASSVSSVECGDLENAF